MRTHTRTVLAFAAGTLILGAALVVAGPLDPPAGPITGTYKTLSDVEPRIAINATNTPGNASCVFNIAQPGSYYLTGDVVAPSGRAAIQLGAVGVTIDLAGFTLRGQAGSTYAIEEMGIPPGQITVRNGAATGFGSGGIFLNKYSLSKQRLVENVHVTGTTGTGIGVGHASVVRRCTVVGFSFAGIMGGDGTTVENCSVRESTTGITVILGGVVRGCAAVACGTGISVGSGSVVEGCSADNCTGTGIGSSGIVRGCSASGNQVGFYMSDGGLAEGCVATANTQYGLRAQDRGTISHCTARQAASAFANIFLGGTDSVAQYNNCSGGAIGIQTVVGGNLIIGNRCAGSSTNYSITVNNRYGPIVDVSAGGGAAVNGNVAASNLTSTDAYANFSY